MRVERAAQRAARAVYGSIIALAVILVLEDGGAEADEVIAAAVGSVIAAMLAEGYAEYIAAVIRERRHPTRAEVVEQTSDVAAGTLAALVPLIPFVGVEPGGLEVETAYDIAPWLGLGVIGFYTVAAEPPRRAVHGADRPGHGRGPGDRGRPDRDQGVRPLTRGRAGGGRIESRRDPATETRWPPRWPPRRRTRRRRAAAL